RRGARGREDRNRTHLNLSRRHAQNVLSATHLTQTRQPLGWRAFERSDDQPAAFDFDVRAAALQHVTFTRAARDVTAGFELREAFVDQRVANPLQIASLLVVADELVEQ